MKSNRLLELLKKSKQAPFYQCPRCNTVWLVSGGQALEHYTCKSCGHEFDITKAHYSAAKRLPDESDVQLPKAA